MRFSARECEVKEIDSETAKQFLEEHHVQKSVFSVYNIGLFYESMLIGVMTFGHPRYNKRYQWELLRVCYHRGHRVIGGTIKMFDYFIDACKPQSVVSYCDYSHFTGKLYEKLGFELSRVSKSENHETNEKGQGTYIWVGEGKFGYIYLTTDTLHNKQYVGQRRGYKPDEGYYGSGRIIRDLIKKYGTEIFTREILDYADSQEELSRKEVEYIKKYDTLWPKGYNLTLRLQAVDAYERNGNCSEESKKKISKAIKEMWKDEGYRKKHHGAVENYWKDESNRAVHKQRMKQVTSSLEYRHNMSNSLKNTWKNEEYRKKVEEGKRRALGTEACHKNLSEGNRKRYLRQEERVKSSIRFKKMWENEEVRRNASDNKKKLWKDENYRKNQIEKMRRVTSTIEYREKMRRISKERVDCKEYREKLSIASKGRKWWNNGEVSKFQREKPDGEEWVRGRLKKNK